MSRMERVKEMLGNAVAENRSKVEASQKAGKIPSDYSLGFTNALIFTDHHINMRFGKPKFFDRTTSVGALPKPMALRAGRFHDIAGGDQIHDQLKDEVVLAARNFMTVTRARTRAEVDALMTKLDATISRLDKFEVDLEEARQGEVSESADAASEDQESSSPSRAPDLDNHAEGGPL